MMDVHNTGRAPIRAAVIGTGAMGRVHRAAWESLPDAELVGVVSRNPRGSGGAPVFASARELVRATGAQLVSICTPSDSHTRWARELAELGVDIVCEKPLALSLEDAVDTVAFCADRGRALHVAHVVRFVAEYVRTAELIASGALGRIVSARLQRSTPMPAGSGSWFHDPARTGGVELDLMIHDFDFAVGLFGVPEQVRAVRRRSADSDAVRASLLCAGGERVVVEGSWGGTAPFRYSCEVVGARATASFHSGSAGAPAVTLTERGRAAETLTLPVDADPYAAQLAAFLALTAGGQPAGAADHGQSLGALETSLLVRRAAASGGTVTPAG